MKSKTVKIEGVGEILLERSDRARTIGLCIRPFKGVRVAVPRGVSFQSAEAVARSKSDWMKKHLEKMRGIEQEAAHLNQGHRIDHMVARGFLVKRLSELSKIHGFSYGRVFVRNQRTRWGSCSAKNNISLNINLVRLPAELVDYTILHELAHTRVKNHGRRFWDELDALVGNAKKLDRKLDAYRLLLLRPKNDL